MLSTCAKQLQWLRYFGFHFTQVPHTYSVSQPLPSHVSLSRNWHRKSAETDVYTQRLEISLLLCCQLVPNSFNDWLVRQNFNSLVVFYAVDTYNIPKTSIVTCYTYTQNLNYITVYVYAKLDFWTLYMYTEFLNFYELYMGLVYIYAKLELYRAIYIPGTWIITRYMHTQNFNLNTVCMRLVYIYP
jgi:hypothetical protein